MGKSIGKVEKLTNLSYFVDYLKLNLLPKPCLVLNTGKFG